LRLLLVRHGQSVANAEGRLQGQGEYPLTELGREQSRRLARRLSEKYNGTAAIYTSSLGRAVETTEILAEAIGAAVIPDDRLQEYNVGALTGLTMDEIQEKYPQVYTAWAQDVDEWVPMPGAEGQADFNQRVGEVFAEIIDRHYGDETVAVVSHGGTLGAYLGQIVGLPPDRRRPFAFSNASLSVVDLSRRRPRLLLLNDTCHISDMGGGR
jgi:broad specificity phosphatase PhoE